MSPSTFHIERAAQLGEEYDERADLCRSVAEAHEEILFLAHIHLRRLSLTLDRLAVAEDAGRRREAFEAVARYVSGEMRALDRDLQHFRTGPLIRLVLHGIEGAVFCDSVLMDEFVLGIIGPVPDGGGQAVPLPRLGPVRRADRAVSHLVDEIRDIVGQPTQNLGGWDTSVPITPTSLPADETSVPPPDAPPASFRRARQTTDEEIRSQVITPEGEYWLADCREAVRDGALHYVALFRGTEQLVEVDSFEGRDVRSFLTNIAPQVRRDLYRQFGREAEIHVAELARFCREAAGMPLLRVVFDVEQGAIMYYRVGDDRHLIAVTLHQRDVSQADDTAGNLVLRCR
jgi:hypothetical protein